MLVQVLSRVKFGWLVERLGEPLHRLNPVDPKGPHGLAQPAIGDAILLAPTVDQDIGLDGSPLRGGLLFALIQNPHLKTLPNGLVESLQLFHIEIGVDPRNALGDEVATSPGDFLQLFFRQDVFDFGHGAQCRPPEQLAPHVLDQSGPQVYRHGFFRREHQWWHAVAAHQGIATLGTALGVHRNTHILEHNDIALHGARRNIQCFGQL